jgi:hypothetical protein
MSRYAAPLALLVVGAFTAAIALVSAGPLRGVQLGVSIALVASSGFLYGSQRTREVFVAKLGDVMVTMPGSIVFHRDDDGHMHALVTTLGGDPRSIDVPDEAAKSPEEAVRYVCNLLGNE